MKTTIQNKDSSTICPVGGVPAELQKAVGYSLRVTNPATGKSLTAKCTGGTAFQLFFKGTNLHSVADGGSKSNPVELEVELLTA